MRLSWPLLDLCVMEKYMLFIGGTFLFVFCLTGYYVIACVCVLVADWLELVLGGRCLLAGLYPEDFS